MSLKDDLLRKGYLPENLPPFFSTADFADYFKKNTPQDYLSRADKPVRPAVYSASKRGFTRRNFSAVHPVTSYDLADFVSSKWRKVLPDLSRSGYSLSIPKHTPEGDRAIEISTHSELEAVRLSKLSQYRFIAKTDISRFYHSIYTHAIPWAFHGKMLAKADRAPKSEQIFFNRADYILRCGQDGQTIGIPVGPDASRLIAETICAGIDAEFDRRNDVDDCRILRHVDDVWIGANSHADAERALWRYREAIRDFELDINESKTRIYSEDFRFSDGWPTEIASQLDFAISSPKRRIAERLRTAFEHAFSSTVSSGDDGILKYAIRYLDQSKSGWSNWETIEPFLKRSAVHFGHTIDYVSRVIVWRNLSKGDLDIDGWTHIFLTTLDRHGRLGNDSEVCWSLYACTQLKIKIPNDIARRIFENCGALTQVALLNCVEAGLLSREVLKNSLDFAMGEDASGPYWPLILEWLSRDWPGYKSLKSNNETIDSLSKKGAVVLKLGNLPRVFRDVKKVDFSRVAEAIEKRVSLYDDGDEDEEDPEDDELF